MIDGRLMPPRARHWAEVAPWSEDPALTGLLPIGRVVTIEGERPADEIEAGDVVIVLARAGYIPVQRTVETIVDLARRPDAAPILIAEAAFDRFSPSRPTVVAPHCLIGIDQWLVPAAALVNGRSVRRLRAAGTIRYLQFEMGHHELLVADGLRVASLRRGAHPCRALLVEGVELEARRARFAERVPGLAARGLVPPAGGPEGWCAAGTTLWNGVARAGPSA